VKQAAPQVAAHGNYCMPTRITAWQACERLMTVFRPSMIKWSNDAAVGNAERYTWEARRLMTMGSERSGHQVKAHLRLDQTKSWRRDELGCVGRFSTTTGEH
jgi:hypothetical protein